MGLVMDDYVAGFLGLGENNAWNIPALDVRISFYFSLSRSESRGHIDYEDKGR